MRKVKFLFEETVVEYTGELSEHSATQLRSDVHLLVYERCVLADDLYGYYDTVTKAYVVGQY